MAFWKKLFGRKKQYPYLLIMHSRTKRADLDEKKFYQVIAEGLNLPVDDDWDCRVCWDCSDISNRELVQTASKQWPDFKSNHGDYQVSINEYEDQDGVSGSALIAIPKSWQGQSSDGLREKDNVGSRYETESEGYSYFATIGLRDPEPILFYFFNTKEDAIKAMSEIPGFAIAIDSKKLICTEVVNFGVFPAIDREDSPTWGALLAGKSLTYDLWFAARTKMQHHGGRPRREDPPQKPQSRKKKKSGHANLVKFSHERQEESFGMMATYRHYTGPDKDTAIAFLKENPVNKRVFFLVVETPDGVFCRDVQGFYEG